MSAEDDAAKAVAALTRQLMALEQAANEADSAAARARHAVDRAQLAGYARVAERLTNLQGRIEKLAPPLSTAAGQIPPAQASAAEAAVQSEPQQAMTKLVATVGAVDTAHDSIAGAVQETTEIEIQVVQVLQGAQPETLLAMLRGVREAATAAAEQGQAAKKHAQDAIAQGQQIAGGGGPGTRPGPADAHAPGPASASAPETSASARHRGSKGGRHASRRSLPQLRVPSSETLNVGLASSATLTAATAPVMSGQAQYGASVGLAAAGTVAAARAWRAKRKGDSDG